MKQIFIFDYCTGRVFKSKFPEGVEDAEEFIDELFTKNGIDSSVNDTYHIILDADVEVQLID